MARSIIHDVVNEVFPAESAAIDVVSEIVSNTLDQIPADEPGTRLEQLHRRIILFEYGFDSDLFCA